MSEFSLLPIRLLQFYGKKAIPIFFPSFKTAQIVTYRSVIELYEKCLSFNDTEALQIINEEYNIEEIMSFSSNHSQVPFIDAVCIRFSPLICLPSAQMIPS